MDSEFRHGRTPVTVTLTPGIASMIAGIFLAILTATVFLIRLDEKVEMGIQSQARFAAQLREIERRQDAQDMRWLMDHPGEVLPPKRTPVPTLPKPDDE